MYLTCCQHVIAALQHDTHAYVAKLRQLLRDLVPCSYTLLKYLCHFLVQVSRHESSNKMGARALGIVFGPSVFR